MDNSDALHMTQHRNTAGSNLGTPIKLEADSLLIIMAHLPTSAPATSKALWQSSGFIAITP